jgi:hypothetical protein
MEKFVKVLLYTGQSILGAFTCCCNTKAWAHTATTKLNTCQRTIGGLTHSPMLPDIRLGHSVPFNVDLDALRGITRKIADLNNREISQVDRLGV